ncbi:MAG: hypothetical protein UZ21_OP11001000083 [Microgenomates bacterium OLB22]|nr:MAG: hypothetical protein UZ21_OP11001000083 [Microgenomates bacterium OLB22]
MKSTSFGGTLRIAWKRSQSLFLPYLIIHVLSGLLMLCVLIVAGLIVIPFVITKNIIVLVPLTIIMGIIALGFVIYISAWSTLIATKLLKDPTKSLKVLAKDTKKDVLALVKTNVLMGVFFIGLLPLGIVSAFTIYIIWSLWAAMTTLSFVYEKRRGLDALWRSKEIVQQKFWSVVGLLVLSTGGSIIINSLFQQFDVPLREVLTNLIGILLSVFVLCGLYELFTQVPKAESPSKRPHLWVLIAKIGYAVLILLIGLAISFGGEQWKEMQNVLQRNIPREIDRTIEQL